MAWEREDACVGCAECIGCGRKFQHWMQCYCDSCGAPIDDIGYLDGNLELCASCAAEAMFCANVEEDRRDYIRQCLWRSCRAEGFRLLFPSLFRH